MFNGEIIFHIKRIKKMLCYYKWKAWYKLLSGWGMKKICARFYHAPNILLTGMKYGAPKWLCSNTVNKVMNWKFILTWAEGN